MTCGIAEMVKKRIEKPSRLAINQIKIKYIEMRGEEICINFKKREREYNFENVNQFEYLEVTLTKREGSFKLTFNGKQGNWIISKSCENLNL